MECDGRKVVFHLSLAKVKKIQSSFSRKMFDSRMSKDNPVKFYLGLLLSTVSNQAAFTKKIISKFDIAIAILLLHSLVLMILE